MPWRHASTSSMSSRHLCPSRRRRCTTMMRSGRRTASSWTAIRRRGPPLAPAAKAKTGDCCGSKVRVQEA
ncbi:hypothetical protein BAE44_0006369 [Dichanthelium oligosanthes]|uniref:Uncharacterized protein n=1 Tax=Dichanthelium oligosanthes TaxID=888268 RepID=A0A1E5W5D8_9POAL|nr:hypothetical protein BAE44_0006369 [Dichanthelium oligosanthes]